MSSYRDLVNQARSLEKERGISLDFADKSIADSWVRCFEQGLRPNSNPFDSVLNQKELNQIQEKYRHIRGYVAPELELLYSQIAGSNFMVAFANNDGVVLDTIYDNQFLNSRASKVVIPGSVWLEKYRGTNGLGLSLQTKSPTIVAGGEHFFTSHGGLSCFASPIFDHNQNIVGVLDASTDTSTRQDHTLALVKLSAKSVEQKIFLNNFRHANVYSFHPRSEYLQTNSIGLIAVNEAGGIEGVNSNARIMLSGVYTDDIRDFYNIFTTPFNNIAHEMNIDKTVQVKDWLGSTVFMKLFQKQQTSSSNLKKSSAATSFKPCSNCRGSTIKEQKCLLIQKTFEQVGGKISAVSKTLNVSRTTVYKHLQSK
jgi:transcriptional regulator of acetoin/glycerol metabolism